MGGGGQRSSGAAAAGNASAFARALAGGTDEQRDAAVKSLKVWLVARARHASALSLSRAEEDEDDAAAPEAILRGDMNKVHRGCFYTMWHADGRRVQHKIAKSLSSLIRTLAKYDVSFTSGVDGATATQQQQQQQQQLNLGLEYLRSMMLVLRREWFGIDRLRMDKFMMFARMLVLDGLRAVGSFAHESDDGDGNEGQEETANGGGDQLFADIIRDCVTGFEAKERAFDADAAREKKKKKKKRKRKVLDESGAAEVDVNRLNDAAGSVGLTMHIASVLLPCLELIKKNKDKPSISRAALDVTSSQSLLEIALPFIEALGGADTSTAVFNRIVAAIVEPMLQNAERAIAHVKRENDGILAGSVVNDAADSADDVEDDVDLTSLLVLERRELRKLSNLLLAIAGSSSTRDDRRGVLYDLQMRLEAASVDAEGMAVPLAAAIGAASAVEEQQQQQQQRRVDEQRKQKRRNKENRKQTERVSDETINGDAAMGAQPQKEKRRKKAKLVTRQEVNSVAERDENFERGGWDSMRADDEDGDDTAAAAKVTAVQIDKKASRKRKAKELREGGDSRNTASPMTKNVERSLPARKASSPAALLSTTSTEAKAIATPTTPGPAKKRVRFALKRNMTKVFDKNQVQARIKLPSPSPIKLSGIIKK